MRPCEAAYARFANISNVPLLSSHPLDECRSVGGHWEADASPLLLRLQKVGGTTVRHVWMRHQQAPDATETLSTLCHLDATMLRLLSLHQQAVRPIIVLIRHPLERVASEYRMCTSTRVCFTQAQWDYLSAAPNLARRFAEHEAGRRVLTLEDFAEWSESTHPAHNRQVEYISGRRFRASMQPMDVLDAALRNLCEFALVLPFVHQPARALRVLGEYFGWAIGSTDLAARLPGGGWRIARRRSTLAAHHPFTNITEATTTDTERATIMKRNALDARLFVRALELFEARSRRAQARVRSRGG